MVFRLLSEQKEVTIHVDEKHERAPACPSGLGPVSSKTRSIPGSTICKGFVAGSNGTNASYLGHFGLSRAIFFRREVFRTCFRLKELWRYLRFAKWPSSRDGNKRNVVGWKLTARMSLGNWGWLGPGNNITVDFRRDFRNCSLQEIARDYIFPDYN